MAHDPTFLGWLTTGAYTAAAATCICAALLARSGHDSSRGSTLAWLSLALGIALLGLNKQLDLQTVMTNRLRLWAERDDWYQHRRVLQATFVLAVICITAGGLGLLLRNIGLRSCTGRITLAGAALLALYLLMRIADIERADQWLGLSLSARFMRAVPEWAGLVLLTIAAWRVAVLAGRRR